MIKDIIREYAGTTIPDTVKYELLHSLTCKQIIKSNKEYKFYQLHNNTLWYVATFTFCRCPYVMYCRNSECEPVLVYNRYHLPFFTYTFVRMG